MSQSRLLRELGLGFLLCIMFGWFLQKCPASDYEIIHLEYVNRHNPFQTVSVVVSEEVLVKIDRTGRPPGENERFTFNKPISKSERESVLRQWRDLAARHPNPYTSPQDFNVGVSVEGHQCLVNPRSKGEMENFLFRDSLVGSMVREALLRCLEKRQERNCRFWIEQFART